MDTIALTMREQQRVTVIQRVFRGELTMAEAAMVLGVSERQSFRIKARIGKEGVRGVIHGNRGRCSPRKLPVKTRHRIVELARGKYRGFNDHHLSEKLAEVEGITVSREAVRQILRCEGLASPRKRRPPRYRARRVRRAAEGMLLQVDGRSQDWLEGRGPALTLVGAIDDATGQVPWAVFVDHETTWAYLQLFWHIGLKQGLPQAVYADRHSIFWTNREPTLQEQLAGQRPLTQVGRALHGLGITLIPAGSPQAKGRVERLWGTFQDRLVSELRLAGATTPAEAQAVLERVLPQHNRRFAKAPAEAVPAWRPVDRSRLIQTLCFKSTGGWWPRTALWPFRGSSCPFLSALPSSPGLIKASMSTYSWMVRWTFTSTTTVSPGLTPPRLAQLAYSARADVARYGPDTTTAAQLYAHAP